MAEQAVTERRTLVDVLTVAQRRLARTLSVALAEESCTLDQWRVLRVLADGDGHVMGELAEKLAIAQPTLTRIVEGLADASLVYRRQSSSDRRRVAVHLSRQGQQRLLRLDALAAAQEESLRATPDWVALVGTLRDLTR